MLDPEQVSALTEMGIPVWELRGTEISEQAVNPVIDLIHEPLPDVDCLVILSEQDNNELARRLLAAMLFSIGLTAKNSAIVSPSQLSQLDAVSAKHKLVLALGDELLPQNLNLAEAERGKVHRIENSTLSIVTSLSLATLLNYPEKKALAWQDLQLASATLKQAMM